MKKILVAMSGGVDSSVTAAMMVDAGYDVTGITMRLGAPDTIEVEPERPNCCSLEGIEDARRVATQLGIPFYGVNYEDIFREQIIDYFVEEYLVGRTPSPCMVCNRELKFGKLLDLAKTLECEAIATGHYARIEKDPETERYLLRKALDVSKDQSYFLAALTQEQLQCALMPLGEYTKTEVRDLARKYQLRTAEKIESQELCFVADTNYRRFLQDRIPEKIESGDIIDKDGNVLGKHQGVPFYTVGQRRGLGIAVGKPLYVTQLKASDNTVVVGESVDLLEDTMHVEHINLISIEKMTEPIRAHVKIRSRDDGGPATISPINETEAIVQFDEPRRAITPGQATVFYDGEYVLGGGWIKTSL
ncbi:MAG: tRNA 2-thiouridine(34) synthase MnmA [Candidatus Poribacteria bacterium]|nr:tRNA 2-thiouridine(34) synthase MnmA [Candidatus Poribacteria bacterium]